MVVFAMSVLAIRTSQSSHSSPGHGALPQLSTLCPYSNMCSFSSMKNFTSSSLASCCQKCSCTKDCQMVGNCCPDTHPGNLTEPVYPCIDVRQLFNEARGLDFRPDYKLWLHVIDGCPNSRLEEAFPACKRPVELQDYVMVSDKAGVKAFKNRHCAMCNGEQEYIVWKSVVSCPEIASFNFKTFAEKNEFILSKCALMSFPPNDNISQMTRCYPSQNVISVCNETQMWNVYDTELEQACQTSQSHLQGHNSLFFKHFVTHIEIYANVYCYLCNHPKTYPTTDICPVDTADVQPNKLAVFINFAAVLNFEFYEDKDDRDICNSSSIYDPFSDMCRQLLCPMGNIPYKGKCERSTAWTVGHSMYVMFEISGSADLEDMRRAILVKNIDKELYRFLGRQFQCGKCDSSFYASRNTSQIFLKLKMFTTQTCQSYNLLNHVKMFENKHFRTQIFDGKNAKQIPYKMTFQTPKDINVTMGIYSFNANPACINALPVTRIALQNCPRIEMSTREVNALNLNPIASGAELHKILIMNERTNKISICVKTYFHLRNLEKGGQGTHHHCTYWIYVVFLAAVFLIWM